GSNIDVTLGDSQSIGDVVNVINKTANGKVTASINSDGKGLTLTDKTGVVGGSFLVSELNGSQAAADLGIFKNGVSGTITGNRLRHPPRRRPRLRPGLLPRRRQGHRPRPGLPH